MSKREQILILDPSAELRFKGPFVDVITSCLKLTNPSDRRVCFKVKTTAPKRYCVRPNNGLVEPKSSVTVAVMLQPFDYDPNEKNKHKFMVQTMFAPDGDINQETLWKDVNPENLMDSKLKCVFEYPTEPTQNNVDSNNVEDKATNLKTIEVPKIAPKSNNLESELRKTTEELRRLEKESNSLRLENIQLKEDSLRMRRQHAEQLSSKGGSGSVLSGETLPDITSTLKSFHSQSGANQQSPFVVVLVVAVASIIIGLILGKIF